MVHQRLASLGVAVPAIMLPAPGVDLDRWGVVACDQYTAQPEYWMQAYEKVGGEPSTLAMILPEAFLGTERAAHLEREGPIKTCPAIPGRGRVNRPGAWHDPGRARPRGTIA